MLKLRNTSLVTPTWFNFWRLQFPDIFSSWWKMQQLRQFQWRRLLSFLRIRRHGLLYWRLSSTSPASWHHPRNFTTPWRTSQLRQSPSSMTPFSRPLTTTSSNRQLRDSMKRAEGNSSTTSSRRHPSLANHHTSCYRWQRSPRRLEWAMTWSVIDFSRPCQQVSHQSLHPKEL